MFGLGEALDVDLGGQTWTGTGAQGGTTREITGVENITGTQLNDTITGDDGDNILDGQAGTDTIEGGNGNDTLEGGAGADTLDGGAGEDTADYGSSDVAVNVALGVFAIGGHSEGDVLTGIEHLAGSSFVDFLQGDSGSNTLDGRGGDDLLVGGGGVDYLIGGAGFDILDGSGGADTLDGGADKDLIGLIGATAAVTLDMSNSANSSSDYASDHYISMEGVFGNQSFSNTIIGDAQDNDIIGGRASDSLSGGDGVDALLSQGGDDIIEGGAGADFIVGGAGDDTMTGGADADVFLFYDNDGSDIITDFTPGTGGDILFFSLSGASFSDLTFSTDSNGDAVISYGTNSSIVFEGVTEAELNPTPGTPPGFIFVF